jgi:arginine deiminase
MAKQANNLPIYVDNEVSDLKRILIHSPDGGLGKVIPTKAQDWLFEDIIHLETMRKKEYDLYVKLLLYFLDYDKIHGKMKEVDADQAKRGFYKPGSAAYFNSDKVMDPEYLLSEILEQDAVRNRLVAAVSAHERIGYRAQQDLYNMEPKELARALVSGILPDGKMIFAPIPNYIFTRDIGIVINDHILVSRPAKEARSRESTLTKYVLFNHPAFAHVRENIIEMTESEDFFLLDGPDRSEKTVTIEGGDVMMVAPNHLLVGVSERTTVHAASRLVRMLFDRNVVEKVSVVRIPKKRSYMHIDTTFTQVKRNLWVIYAPFSKEGKQHTKRELLTALGEKQESFTVQITQFINGDLDNPKTFEYLEDLLTDVSATDLNCTEPAEFIYSGNGVFPFGQREQWTDSCNVLALKEGVVIGYDRNDHTAEGFNEKGIASVTAAELLRQFEAEEIHPSKVENTLILLPSAELSRARGGSHCISMPLQRTPILG